ncbi:hypothetical protein H5410_059870 [Solanum commersonii]|uniref:Ubiquitin-like protease family profile domain-containing protein n=1 Tax=Solanum commersonii TaxID=4109 RepID=A0A9J5W4A0_SOLCO|nr:hypothetical protein H5410_059870 [Solanum commersonii]
MGSSSKAKDAKTKKKRGRKVAPPILRPTLPMNMKYVIKHIPKQPLKFGPTYNSNFKENIELSIKDEGMNMFKDTIFGQYLNIPKCHYQGQITKCLYLLEVEHDNLDKEIHIRHAKRNVLQFSIREFAIITGLKCTGNVKDFTYSISKISRLVQRYFPGPNYNVTKGRLVDRFELGIWDSSDDALQMTILYFIHTFVFSQLGDAPIPIEDFFMVEDGSYKQFLWGQLAFMKLMKSFRKEYKPDKQMYRLNGFPYALNIWVYEYASAMHNEIAVREGNGIPRVWNWKVNDCSNVQPTQEELESLDLPNNSHVPPNRSATSVANQEEVQPDDVSGFEEFSSKPPEQLLRRCTRVSTTASTPPPKRRKVAHSTKNNVPKTTPDVQKNQPFQTPISQPLKFDNVSAVHLNTVPRRTSSDNARLEDLEGHIKSYVDQKIGALEALIIKNHSKLMKAVAAKDNKSDKDIGDISMPHIVDDSVVKGNVVLDSASDQLFQQPISPIHMDFASLDQNGDAYDVEVEQRLGNEENVDKIEESFNKDSETVHHDVDASDVEVEQRHVNEENVAKTMEDSTNAIPTIHHSDFPIEEFVHNKEVEDAVHNVTQLHTKVLSCDKVVADSIQQESKRHASNPVIVDISDSSKVASIPSGTETVIDTIVYKLPNEPINVAPLSIIIPQQLTNSDDFLSDSQLPTQLPIKEFAHNLDTKTPAPRNRIPSKILQSPYVNTFGSSDKGKGKIDDDIRPYTPFEGCGITYQVSSLLMQEYSQWIQKGLLKTHANKKPSNDKYRGKNALFGFDYMDFFVAFPLDKNWLYTMSQPKKCWTDQHIDVIFYYLRKKSKLRSMDQYRYTTCNCLFSTYIKNAYKRYYCSPADDTLSTQQHIARADVVSVYERSIKDVINGFFVPAALPWHLVDEVYIPINCDEEFHWVLGVVVLRNRLIRVYDSNLGTRNKSQSDEIKQLSIILPNYLHDSGFFDKTDRIDWATLDAYKDNKTGELMGPQHPFEVEFARGIMQQKSDSLDCGTYVAAFAEFLSDEIKVPSIPFQSEYLRSRYATLLWKYGTDKANSRYVSENDDPIRLKAASILLADDVLFNVD